MAKRRADRDLNHDNWNDEEEEEDYSGPFKRASKEELAKRVIKTVKRRGTDLLKTESSTGVFKNFSGFGSIGSTGPSKLSSFDITAVKSPQKSSKFEATSFKISDSNNFPSTTTASFNFGQSSNYSQKPQSSTLNGSEDELTSNQRSTNANAEGNNKAYLSNLRALNEGVLKWIQKHTAENININLMPVFDDYKRHFEELERKFRPKFSKKDSLTKISEPVSQTSNGNASPEKQRQIPSTTEISSSPGNLSGSTNAFKAIITSPQSALGSKSISPFNLNENKTKDSESSFGGSNKPADSTPTFSFGTDSTKKDSGSGFSFSSSTSKPFPPVAGTAAFSFGAQNTTPATSGDKPAAPAFSFGTTTGGLTFGAKDGFSFGKGSAPAFSFGQSNTGAQESKTTASTNDDDYTPPQNEVVEVKEDDAVYEKKCKLFYKNNAEFADKGVGTLFLKPVPDTKKTQLVVRAATSLGNVLLNILLNPSMPTQRTGKNNVLIVCIPNPPIDPKSDNNTPVTMLIRVKTAQDADELLEKINEFKSQQ